MATNTVHKDMVDWKQDWNLTSRQRPKRRPKMRSLAKLGSDTAKPGLIQSRALKYNLISESDIIMLSLW